MSKRILVTGGAGFIGSHIVDLLLARNFEVVVLDNLSTGERSYINSEVEFIEGDVSKPEHVAIAFAKKPDAVLHIAGQASIRLSFMHPEQDLTVNTLGTINVLNQCVAARVPRLLFASSMTIYGTPQIVPTPETAPPSPVSYYAVTKYAAERYVHITGKRKDIDFQFDVTSLRMFNVYGPRQSLTNAYQGVLAIFIGNVLRGEPITIHSDGQQSRDFVHVSDVARAWVDAIDAPATYGEVINIGAGVPVSVNQLCDLVLEHFGYTRETYPVVYHAAQPGDIRISCADIGRASTLLNWKPSIEFSIGIRDTMEWAQQQLVQNYGDNSE